MNLVLSFLTLAACMCDAGHQYTVSLNPTGNISLSTPSGDVLLSAWGDSFYGAGKSYDTYYFRLNPDGKSGLIQHGTPQGGACDPDDVEEIPVTQDYCQSTK